MMSETLLLEDYHGIGGTGMQLHFGFNDIKHEKCPEFREPGSIKTSSDDKDD